MIKEEKKTILFYSSVKSKKMFSIQKFYKTDISILKDLGYRVSLSNSMFDYLLFWKYDIAFIYFYRYGLIPAIISKFFRKKVVITGGIDFLDKDYAKKKAYLIQKLFFRLCIIFSDKNIIVSNADLKNIKTFKPKLDQNKFPISFHVIEYDKFVIDNVNKKEKIITTIAWMGNVENVTRKGIDKAIFLFKEIHDLDNDFRMLIIGPQGKGSDFIREIIRENQLDNLITLTGAVSEEDKISILKRSLIYAQLSIYEGFGIAAVEALASGNIVVHTNVGGLTDGIANNGLIAAKDLKSTVRQIFSLLDNDKEYQMFLNNGLSHVSENFRYEKRLEDFKKIFLSM